MLEALYKYAEFSGRSARKELWLFFLFSFLVQVVATMMDMLIGTYSFFYNLGVLQLVVVLALFIPSMAVAVRRLHDTDRTGWWLLLAFLPLIGFIILLIFYCLDGTHGDNRYGADPKAGERAGVPA